ncbi:hypothetical protein M3J09_001657 [Ascochyta lentis]
MFRRHNDWGRRVRLAVTLCFQKSCHPSPLSAPRCLEVALTGKDTKAVMVIPTPYSLPSLIHLDLRRHTSSDDLALSRSEHGGSSTRGSKAEITSKSKLCDVVLVS